MTKTMTTILTLACLVALGACQQSGTAPPSGSYSQKPGVGIGEPGSGAP